MNKAYHKTLFVFRQDLRLHDNTALSEAIAQSDQIIPVFIFDETILQHFPAKDKRIGFLVDAIRQLDTQLRKK